MKFVTNFTNLGASIGLLYVIFQLVPNLLSANDTFSVILGALIIVSILAVVIPQFISLFNKIKGK